MKAIIFIITLNLVLFAKINVVTSYAYIADITKQVGGDLVKVKYLANPAFDPHFITPKPSHIAKLRRADLVITNGGELEIGWMPPLLKNANNPKLAKNTLELFNFMRPIEIPHKHEITRENGDIHPHGNPHFHLRPSNILRSADFIAYKLGVIDPDNEAKYQANFKAFEAKWNQKSKSWYKVARSLRGKKVIQYHKLFSYLLKEFGVKMVAEIEPKPGITPNARHIEKLIKIIKDQKVNFIVQDIYHSSEIAKYLAKKTGIRVITLPHDVNSLDNTSDMFELFDEIFRRLSR
jgi:zinc/manganese transport system substrate-binding protein